MTRRQLLKLETREELSATQAYFNDEKERLKDKKYWEDLYWEQYRRDWIMENEEAKRL